MPRLTSLRAFSFLIGTLVFLALSAAADTVEPGKILGGKDKEFPDWFKESFLDITTDVGEATESGKHLILFMDLNGCPYCFKMLEENFKHAPYSDFIRENFDVIVINIKGDREVVLDEETTLSEKELARRLKVPYTPTIVFLDSEKNLVAKISGYRSVDTFKHVLDYVHEKAYGHTALTDFVRARQATDRYTFRSHPQFREITDLQSVTDRPLALVFEDGSCDACDALHDGHLKNPEVNAILEHFTVVRLDASSTEPIIDVAGNATTPKDYVDALGLTYRPGIVLFDRGKEITRIQSMLYTYHFTEVLRYVGERHYQTYPNSFYDYLAVRSDSILKTGQNIDLSR